MPLPAAARFLLLALVASALVGLDSGPLPPSPAERVPGFGVCTHFAQGWDPLALLPLEATIVKMVVAA